MDKLIFSDISYIRKKFISYRRFENVWVFFLSRLLSLILTSIIYLVSGLSIYYMTMIEDYSNNIHETVINVLFTFLLISYNFVISHFLFLDISKTFTSIINIIKSYEE